MASSGFTCMQCGSHAGALRLSDCRDHYLQKPYSADYHECRACGLVQQSPLPSSVADFYEAYPIHEKKSLAYRIMRSIVMSASYFDLRRFLRRWRQPQRPVLVDLGCGDGWFLENAAGLDVERVGFELDPVVAEHLSARLGVPVYSDRAALARDYGGKVDLVTMHFVMEHVTDLNETVALIATLLKPAGVLHFVVPNISSWEARLFGKKWHNLDCPRHISFPEARAVRQLAERWGLSLEKSFAVPFPNGIAGSIPVVLTGRFSFPLFLASLPLGIVLSRLFPSGNMAFRLVRQGG